MTNAINADRSNVVVVPRRPVVPKLAPTQPMAAIADRTSAISTVGGIWFRAAPIRKAWRSIIWFSDCSNRPSGIERGSAFARLAARDHTLALHPLGGGDRRQDTGIVVRARDGQATLEVSLEQRPDLGAGRLGRGRGTQPRGPDRVGLVDDQHAARVVAGLTHAEREAEQEREQAEQRRLDAEELRAAGIAEARLQRAADARTDEGGEHRQREDDDGDGERRQVGLVEQEHDGAVVERDRSATTHTLGRRHFRPSGRASRAYMVLRRPAMRPPAGLLLVLALTLSGCALPKNVVRPPSSAILDPKGTTLGELIAPVVASHAPGESGFVLYNTGEGGIQARVALADVAQSSIDAQYYLWAGDSIGRVLIQHLVAAANRGVRVRLLVDDYESHGQDTAFETLQSHPNIEVRVFNPFARGTMRLLQLLGRFNELNRRAHNKLFVADGNVAVVGGRNLTDDYFGLGKKLGFRDFDLLAIGPVVREAEGSFDNFWNSKWAYPINSLRKPASQAERERGERAGPRQAHGGSGQLPVCAAA